MKAVYTFTLILLFNLAQSFAQPSPTVTPIPFSEAEDQIITTYAGTGSSVFNGDKIKAVEASLDYPSGIACDDSGNLYIADRSHHRIRMVSSLGIIDTVAGNGRQGYYIDDILAINAELNDPADIAIDTDGNLYIADLGNHRLRKVNRSGMITTFAGTGRPGYDKEGVPARESKLNSPISVAVDQIGNIYIANYSGHRVQRVDPSGLIYTVAGTGNPGYNGDEIPAIQANLYHPCDLAVDSKGNLFIADFSNNRTRKVDANGIITTIAGTGNPGYTGDKIPATQSNLNASRGITVDGAGNVYIADTHNRRVRKVDTSGVIYTIAGTGEPGYSGDQGRATEAKLTEPISVALDWEGNLYVSDRVNRIRKITKVGPSILPPTPTVTPVPTLDNRITFEGETLISNQLTADPPPGFTMGKIAFTNIPTGSQTDGKGMEIKLAPGQGVWVPCQKPYPVSSLAKVSGVFKASSKSVFIALVALNSPVDGQLAYTNFTGEEVPIDDYRQVHLFYEPPSDQVQVAVQVVNSPLSTLSATVWVDNLNVEETELVVTGNPVSLEVDGSFEKGLEKLITNLNETDGTITPFFESLTDIAIRLAVDPSQLAANLGTTVTGVADQFPMRLMGQVNVKRELPTTDGTLAMVMTNGFQNFGLFRFVKEIPTAQDANQEYLLLGGDFLVNNPNVPIHMVVQNGGPNVSSSVVVDDLLVVKQ